MVKGLQTGNAALVAAAADEMHANAADVSGNNVPVNGGTYNPDGLTVADVLSTAGTAPAAAVAAAPAAPAAATAAAPATAAAAPVAQNVAAATASTSTPASNGGADASHSGANPANDPHHFALTEIAHHFQHMWG
jgi:hypothetical protein